jgi:hypothetical protein
LEAAFGPDELSVLARSGGVGAAGPA